MSRPSHALSLRRAAPRAAAHTNMYLPGWRSIAPLFVALVLSTACDRLLVDPAQAPEPMSVALALVSADASGSSGPLEALSKADRVWIRLTRVSTGHQFDTIVHLSRTDTKTRVQLAVSADQGRGPIQIATQVRVRELALFEGATVAALEVGVPQRVEVALTAVPAALSLPDSVRTLTAIGDSARLSAAVLFATGDTIPGLPITWTSDNPAVAAVTSGTWVVAKREGEARLAATHGSLARVLPVRVEARVTTVLVTPDSITVKVGETRNLQATALDRSGNELVRTVAWSSTKPDVVSVDVTGRATALAPGIAKVTASVGDVAGDARIRVIP